MSDGSVSLDSQGAEKCPRAQHPARNAAIARTLMAMRVQVAAWVPGGEVWFVDGKGIAGKFVDIGTPE